MIGLGKIDTLRMLAKCFIIHSVLQMVQMLRNACVNVVANFTNALQMK